MTEVQKECRSCLLAKPLSEFYKDKAQPDGLYRKCRTCHRQATEKWRLKNSDVVAANARKSRARRPEASKEISNRSQKKAYAANPDKFIALSKKNYEKNKDKALAYHKDYRAKNVEKRRAYATQYYLANQEKLKANISARAKEMAEELRPQNAEKAMRYAARKKNATPAWASTPAIMKFYDAAAELTKSTGIDHHVDHIVPLQSKKVCGLHVETNLQILTKSENQSKGNRFWPDMW